jgi:hypothetical protein
MPLIRLSSHVTDTSSEGRALSDADMLEKQAKSTTMCMSSNR